MRLPCLASLASVLLLAVPSSAHSGRDADPSILALVSAFSDARANFDAQALDVLLTPDYVEISPRGEIDERDAVLGFYAANNASPPPPMSLSTQDVRDYGDTAVVIGSVVYTIPLPTGGNVQRTVRVTYVERRLGDRWLMAATHHTGVQP